MRQLPETYIPCHTPLQTRQDSFPSDAEVLQWNRPGSQCNGRMDACSYLCRREGLVARKTCSQSARKWFWPPLAERILDYTGRWWSHLPLCCHHSGSRSGEFLGHCRKWQWKLRSSKNIYFIYIFIFNTALQHRLYLDSVLKQIREQWLHSPSLLLQYTLKLPHTQKLAYTLHWASATPAGKGSGEWQVQVLYTEFKFDV